LGKRLEDVLRRCPDVVGKLVKKRSFIHHVYTARNYLTHYDPSLEEKTPTGSDLYRLTMQLQALVEMCLLLELGFDRGEIDALFNRVDGYREGN
jgi:ApeA N-terminal domain 1